MDRNEELFAAFGLTSPSRRSLLRTLGGGAVASLAAWSLAGCGGDDNNTGNGNNNGGGSTTPFTRDVDILNFALHLEYLEAEFYTYATTGQGIESQNIQTSGGNGFAGGTATAGTTTGTFQTNFGSNTQLRNIALELAADERLHVTLLRNVITSLGGTPIAKPSLNLAALPNVDLTTVNGFLTASRAFEDVGVSAYGGAAPFVQTDAVLQGSARVLAVEAEHAGNIRLQTNLLGLTLTPIDSLDVVPPVNGNGSNSFTVDTNPSSPTAGLAVVRTPLQVLNIVLAGNTNTLRGGFFPNGIYANTNTLLNLR